MRTIINETSLLKYKHGNNVEMNHAFITINNKLLHF